MLLLLVVVVPNAISNSLNTGGVFAQHWVGYVLSPFAYYRSTIYWSAREPTITLRQEIEYKTDTKVDNTLHTHTYTHNSLFVACSHSHSIQFLYARTNDEKHFRAHSQYDIIHFIQFYLSIREMKTKKKKEKTFIAIVYSSSISSSNSGNNDRSNIKKILWMCVCVCSSMSHEEENTQMMVIIFECNQTICKCSMLGCWNAMPKAFPLEYESSYSRFFLLACSRSCSHSHSRSFAHSLTHTHALIHTERERELLCVLCLYVRHDEYIQCVWFWLLSDTLCDSNAGGECDFIHMPSKWMAGFFIVAVVVGSAAAAATAAFSFRAFIRHRHRHTHWV